MSRAFWISGIFTSIFSFDLMICVSISLYLLGEVGKLWEGFQLKVSLIITMWSRSEPGSHMRKRAAALALRLTRGPANSTPAPARIPATGWKFLACAESDLWQNLGAVSSDKEKNAEIRRKEGRKKAERSWSEPSVAAGWRVNAEGGRAATCKFPEALPEFSQQCTLWSDHRCFPDCQDGKGDA